MVRRLLPLALCTALALPAALRPATQDPVRGGQDDEDVEKEDDDLESYKRDVFGRLRKGRGNPLLGAWDLQEMKAEGFPEAGLDGRGVLIFNDDFVAFTVQVFYDDDPAGYDDGYHSFIGEYRLVDGDQLRILSIIGAYMDEHDQPWLPRPLLRTSPGGALQFEQTGFPREFRTSLEAGSLTLRWGQHDRMTFTRRRASGNVQQDLFGRRVDNADPNRGPDIFGRRALKEDKDEDENEGDGDGDGDGDGR